MLRRGYGSDYHKDIGIAVQRGNCGGTSLIREFCPPVVPCGKEGWKLEASNKHEVPQSICENRAFQDGGAPSASRPSTVSGLDGEDGPERCLSPGPYSLRLTTTIFSIGGHNYMFRCLRFSLSSAPQVFTKLLKPLVGFLVAI